MATAWRRNPTSSLETQLWQTLCIEGKTFLAKGNFTKNSYSVLLTDLGVIWEENLNEEKLLERSKSLNPYIEAPPSVILEQLSHRLLEQPVSTNCKYGLIFNEESLTVSVSGPLQDNSGPEFQWNFILSKTPSLVLKHQLVNPLLSMSVELLRQRNELVKIINKKEREIKDYKENGAVISRKHLETLPFDEKAFTNEMICSKEFESFSINPLSSSLSPAWQELYRDVSLCHIWVTSEKDLSNDPGSSMETWKNKLPSSLTPSPVISPNVSPRKRPLDVSPSKDVEKSRRLELEKKLEDSKAKTKKKKKKLIM